VSRRDFLDHFSAAGDTARTLSDDDVAVIEAPAPAPAESANVEQDGRRQHARIENGAEVRLWLVEDNRLHPAGIGRSVDVSRGGMLLRCKGAWPVAGRRLVLSHRLSLTPLYAEVIRVQKGLMRTRVAVQFSPMPDHLEPELERHAKELGIWD